MKLVCEGGLHDGRLMQRWCSPLRNALFISPPICRSTAIWVPSVRISCRQWQTTCNDSSVLQCPNVCLLQETVHFNLPVTLHAWSTNNQPRLFLETYCHVLLNVFKTTYCNVIANACLYCRGQDGALVCSPVCLGALHALPQQWVPQCLFLVRHFYPKTQTFKKTGLAGPWRNRG